MFNSAVRHRFGAERTWTEHLATSGGVVPLLSAVAGAPLPEHLGATIREILAEFGDGSTDRGDHLVTHQFHLHGRYPDVVVHDVRDRCFAVIEAQRGRADDKHIAKLAAHYVPDSGARLGILVAEDWSRRFERHPALAVCPAPVVVVRALDTMHDVTYEVAWVHHPPTVDDL